MKQKTMDQQEAPTVAGLDFEIPSIKSVVGSLDASMQAIDDIRKEHDEINEKEEEEDKKKGKPQKPKKKRNGVICCCGSPGCGIGPMIETSKDEG